MAPFHDLLKVTGIGVGKAKLISAARFRPYKNQEDLVNRLAATGVNSDVLAKLVQDGKLCFGRLKPGSDCLPINSASKWKLKTLDGIDGPMASKIVAARTLPFKSEADMQERIEAQKALGGPSRWPAIKKLLTDGQLCAISPVEGGDEDAEEGAPTGEAAAVVAAQGEAEGERKHYEKKGAEANSAEARQAPVKEHDHSASAAENATAADSTAGADAAGEGGATVTGPATAGTGNVTGEPQEQGGGEAAAEKEKEKEKELEKALDESDGNESKAGGAGEPQGADAGSNATEAVAAEKGLEKALDESDGNEGKAGGAGEPQGAAAGGNATGAAGASKQEPAAEKELEKALDESDGDEGKAGGAGEPQGAAAGGNATGAAGAGEQEGGAAAKEGGGNATEAVGAGKPEGTAATAAAGEVPTPAPPADSEAPISAAAGRLDGLSNHTAEESPKSTADAAAAAAAGALNSTAEESPKSTADAAGAAPAPVPQAVPQAAASATAANATAGAAAEETPQASANATASAAPTASANATVSETGDEQDRTTDLSSGNASTGGSSKAARSPGREVAWPLVPDESSADAKEIASADALGPKLSGRTVMFSGAPSDWHLRPTAKLSWDAKKNTLTLFVRSTKAGRSRVIGSRYYFTPADLQVQGEGFTWKCGHFPAVALSGELSPDHTSVKIVKAKATLG